MLTILVAIVVLGILIFIHETGHFLTAKLFGMRVERFSLGYPPRMVGKKVGETDYCISWIPFGGYVKIAGMVNESMDKETLSKEPQPWEFRSKSWFQKVVVVSAGSLTNILFAFLIFFAVALFYGIPEQVPGIFVGSVTGGKPADLLGLQSGDKIVSVEGKDVDTWDQMTQMIYPSAGRELHITWMRNDSLFSGVITPVLDEIEVMGQKQEVGMIGIASQTEFRRRSVGFGQAVVIGGAQVVDMGRLILVSIYKLIVREESLRNLGGPVFIAKMAGESARSGFGSLVVFMAFLSLNLGILNLMPIPVLDGGHLVILNIEGLIRRPLPLKAKLAIQQVGMVLIFSLMIFAIYNDIIRFFQK